MRAGSMDRLVSHAAISWTRLCLRSVILIRSGAKRHPSPVARGAGPFPHPAVMTRHPYRVFPAASSGHSASRHHSAIASVAASPNTQYPEAMAAYPHHSISAPEASSPTGSP